MHVTRPDDRDLDRFARRLTRRTLLRNAAGLVAAAPVLSLLAACGGDDEPTGNAPTSTAAMSATSAPTGSPTAQPDASPEDTSAATPAAEAAFPVTVEHKFGSTTIDRAPQRVLSLGYNDQDHILAFGVTPVAARYWYGDETNVIFPWAESALTGPAPAVLNMPELDIELIATYSPDLIVAIYSGITAEEYATLSQLAPTVAQLEDYIDYGMPWEETTRLVGAALGQPQRAEEIITEVEGVFAAHRAANPILETSTTVAATMEADGGSFNLFAAEDGRARFLTNLGLTIPDDVNQYFDDGAFYANLSSEKLDILNSIDVVSWLQVSFAGGRDVIAKHPVYSKLRVAQEGRHIFVEGSVDDAMAFNSALSIPYALETLAPHLVAALDGDPATNEPPMI